jgi:anti-sigma regulatory factor (Ser/Thr protein kinase)
MGEPTEWSHEQSWLGRPQDVAASRHFVAAHLRDHDLHDLVDDARLVVSELSANAVQHADTPYTVTLTSYDGVVEIAVGDGDGELMTGPSFHAHAFGLGGRGLGVVGQLSSEWGVRPGTDGGKTVWALLTV